jgi:hypothetical protein
MPRVLLNFQQYRSAWTAHFIEADCCTPIGPRTRFYPFPTLESLRSFVVRCAPEDLAEFDRRVKAWGRGSNYVRLTREQYAKLGQSPIEPPSVRFSQLVPSANR